ncbi:MAG: hypothetical protein QNJ54_00005 [Prochloraceae cyanobacterium]|nr:hypothetical protein [Prochloraceae cyanobacterium]
MKSKLQKLSLIGVFLVASSAIGYGSLQARETENLQQTKGRGYPSDFATTYKPKCMEQATQHLPEEDAVKICDCTRKRFQILYSYEQYQKLSSAEQQDVGLYCSNKVLDSE